MRFQNQSFLAHLFNFGVQVFLAITFSFAHGAYWLWICPTVMLLLIPKARMRAWVVVDDNGVQVGGTMSLVWTEIESLAERRWARAVFVLKEGGRKSLWTSDWPTENKEDFYVLLQKRGLYQPTAGQEGTTS